MASVIIATSYKKELFMGTHGAGDDYRVALFTAEAALGADTARYSTAGEVVGEGYAPGGELLKSLTVGTGDGGSAWLRFREKIVWENSTITARQALIYNATKGGKAVAVVDFGENTASRAGTFTVVFPDEPLLTIK